MLIVYNLSSHESDQSISNSGNDHEKIGFSQTILLVQ
jgi:hypothetical protein